MQIIVKFLIKNICDKKFRTFLILISIILSSALFFASSAMSGTFTQSYIKKMRVSVGNVDIIVKPDSSSDTKFISTNGAQKYSDQLEYIIGTFYSKGVYEYERNKAQVPITLIGINYDDLQQINPVYLDSQSKLLPFDGKKIILSKDFMEEHNLNLGDTIELKIEGRTRRYEICGKANPAGFFTNEGGNITAVVPRKALASFYGVPQKSNQISVKLKNTGNTDQMIRNLKSDYKNCTVESAISEEELNNTVNKMAVPFMIITIIVSMISLYIIFSSFRVITLERLPVIGTLRSVGATRKITDLIMFLESMFYGIFGAIPGVGLGIGVLNLVAIGMKSSWEKVSDVKVYYGAMHIISTFVFAVVLCFASSIIPIIKASKIPIKDIILNTIEKVKPRKRRKTILGVIFIAAGIILPPYTPRNISLLSDTACTIFAFIGIVFLIPDVIIFFVKVFERVYGVLFGNIGVLSVKNLKENKSIQGNTSLMTIGISAILAIYMISNSFAVELGNFYQRATFGILLRTDNIDRNFISLLRTIDGVDDTYETYELNGVQVKGQSSRISAFQGTDTMEFFKYWDIEVPDNVENIINKMNTGRYIFLSNVLKETYNVEVGDKLVLMLNDNEREYEVVGFFDSLRNNGSYALISKKFLKQDCGLDSYTDVYIKTTGDSYKVKSLIQEKFKEKDLWIKTIDELAKMNKESSDQLFSILKAFSLIALLIGVIGIVNNLIISFIQRKRSFAVFKSVGMSKRQIVLMLFIEALTGGIIGGIVGVAGALMLTVNSGEIMLGVNLFIPINISGSLIIISILAAILLQLTATISPALKTSKLNIIDTIKSL